MTTAAIYLVTAFAAGLVAIAVRLPPLVGFLAAGFVLHGTGVEPLPVIEPLADLGVTLLLFGIGLKFDVRTLIRPEIWFTAVSHMALSVGLALGGFGLLVAAGVSMVARESFASLALLGFALSFSSTVFVVKVLDERSDATTLYGRVAIGVLVMQDLAAVAFITSSTGEVPSPWAFGLVLLLPAAWVMRRIWSRLGHGEMQALFGVLMALVPGYWLFETVGLKGDLGALVMGILLASHPAANELSQTLWNLKELLLVGFFVSIGLEGLPSLEGILVAVLLVVLLPLQGIAYAVILSLMRLRHRNSVLAALALTNYSEFGLIVVSLSAGIGWLDDQWLVVLALAVALSFLVSAAVNRRGIDVASWISDRLPEQDPEQLLPADRPIDVGDVRALVLGMGRVGRTAYQRLEEKGLPVLGVEHNQARVDELVAAGLSVVRADATDRDFWLRVGRAGEVHVAVLAMPFHGSNLEAYEMLRACRFHGRVAAVARYDEEVDELQRLGAESVFQLYSGAGTALADTVLEEEDSA
ncbi:cation:proton antiporter [Nocardioides panacisoli]|uniref:cation:proton antiporter family protein n=1 Tax=Nocardioides panacisoli TaxID=627624 RepID=UPI001C628674|nr:cation:proton antiporter family protein [Nocardioides panacisoli]QYJ05079.1 cation:proton antiporter [Nocardioides panacisoli]